MQHRVAIVEDDPATRQRLGAAITGNAALRLVASVGTCQEARALLAREVPDVLLADLGLPDGDGIDVIRAASAAGAECMVITVFGDERHVVAALEAGAGGYLLKDASLDDIAGAVLRLLEGESPISPKIARYLVRRFQQVPAGRAAATTTLTERELEVLSAIAKGYSYAEIAQSLAMSPHTVATHVKHIYRKLAVGSRGEAVFEAAHLGLVRLERD